MTLTLESAEDPQEPEIAAPQVRLNVLPRLGHEHDVVREEVMAHPWAKVDAKTRAYPRDHSAGIRHPFGSACGVMVGANATRIDVRGPVTYERRRPERTVLYETLQQHIEPFIGDVEVRADRALRYFVKKELRDFLVCGT